MKILITFYDLNDLGGIINNQEGLIAGLRALGHDVTVRKLVWKTEVRTARSGKGDKIHGEMDLLYDQRSGWTWTGDRVFAYKGTRNLKRWKEFASRFDLIIWQIPVPSKAKANLGNLDWLELYDVNVPQVAYVHDGNLRDGAPHIYAIQHHLSGVIGVHPCAYHALASVPLPRAMAFSPQMNIEQRIKEADSALKERTGFFSLQTFKGWKHVEDLVRAIPHMNRNIKPRIIAGGGIQWYYMTSPDKTKPAFRVNVADDPDCCVADVGKRIWDLALEYGMEYLGYVHNEQREDTLQSVRLLVDPSWSTKYAKVGDHFNRVVVDALIAGAVPVARNLGISTNEEGIGELFKPDEHYFMIPYDATPKEFATYMEAYHTVERRHHRDMVMAGRRELVPHFDYRCTAQAFVDMAAGVPAGYYGGFDVGGYDSEMAEAGERLVNGFFSGKEAT
jgi:glycosyltransferase involved in cell wall biosynthesis